MGSSAISLGLGLGGGKSATSSGTPGGTPFANQYSVSFDGSDDYMSIPDADIFSMGNGSGTDNAFSISGWFNANSLNAFYIVTKDGSGAGREWAFRTVSSQLHFFAFGTGGGYIGRKDSTTSLNTGQWYHAVVTYDASKASSGIKLYLNGTRVDDADYASGTFTAARNSSTLPRVGAVQSNSTYSNGLIDEVAIFNTELSASDISTLRGGASAGTLGVPADISSLSPVGWWRMGDNDSGTGTTITDQGSGSNNGSLENGPTFSTSVPEYVFNQNSVSLDGSDDYMDIPDSTALETTAFTWSAWFYCTAINRYNIIVDTATSSTVFNGYELFVVNTTNKIRFASYHSNDSLDSTTVVSANTWFHVAATHESGSDKLYVNGSLEASGSASNFNVSDAANLRIGSSNIYDLYHQGLIDEVAFFNSALSASDVTAIYNSGVPADLTSLSPVGWWRMGDNDGGTGTTITNQGSASSIDGTLTNGPTFSTTVPS